MRAYIRRTCKHTMEITRWHVLLCQYYNNQEIHESLYKAHLQAHHGNHKVACPVGGCILMFKDKADVQLHLVTSIPKREFY